MPIDQATMVLPGDDVAVAEEYEPGEGTYERGGHIFAAMPGVLQLDDVNRIARVRAFNPPAEPNIGDIVYAVVDDIRGMMATATVNAIHGRARQISGAAEGTIHISNVSEDYTEDIHDMFHLGDIIRAKVIQAEPSLQLTTAEPALGVVRAMCSNCRGPMVRRDPRTLFCPRCERTEQRKLARDYDNLELDVSASDLGGGIVHERPRGPSEGREGYGRGRDRGGRGGREHEERRDRRGGRGRGGRGREQRPRYR